MEMFLVLAMLNKKDEDKSSREEGININAFHKQMEEVNPADTLFTANKHSIGQAHKQKATVKKADNEN